MKQSDFDKYEDSYVETVERSIQFSGLKHDFFQQAKQKMLRQVIYKHFRGNEKLSLLDVGCGVGSLHPYIKELVHSIVGVDISHQSIKRAKLNNSDNRYFSYDGERLPFEANKFNIVMAVCVMHHVHPDKWSFFLSEMSRVTQENGLVVVIEHNPLNPLTKFAVSRCPFDVDATLLSARRVSKL
ncbi:class I SAM-dependent methyltransferase, partial [Fangia hongkongensis]